MERWSSSGEAAQHVAPRPDGGMETASCLVLTVIWCALVWMLYRGAVPPDLSAIYMAGHLFGSGETDLLYAIRPVGESGPPPAWDAAATEVGLAGQRMYTYVYPPLWAALAAPAAQIASPAAFFAAAYPVMAGLVALTIFLVLRALRPPGNLAIWFGLSLAAVLMTIVGQLAFYNCQPQILVGFLLVLAIERQLRGWPVIAGLALALAASIKLYPALFLLWFIAARDFRAISAFLLCGTVLGLLSLLLGGWTLHLDFLTRVSEIGNEVHGIPYNLNLENLLFQLGHAGSLPTSPETGAVQPFMAPDPGWMNGVVIASALGGVLLLAARWRALTPSLRFGALFPAALIGTSLCLPLGWSHQFLPVLAFLPNLLRFYGRGVGGGLLLLSYLLQSFWLTGILDATPGPVMLPVLVGTGLYVTLFFLFIFAPARR